MSAAGLIAAVRSTDAGSSVSARTGLLQCSKNGNPCRHDQPAIWSAGKFADRSLDLPRVSRIDGEQFDPERRCHRLNGAQLAEPCWELPKHRDACHVRGDPFEQLQPFSADAVLDEGKTGCIAPRPRHAAAIDSMRRSCFNAVLTGPISTRPSGWPSARRGTGALPPAHLDMNEDVKPIEQHGFTIADFASDKIVLRMFRWDVKRQSVEAIDNLDPFHTAVLTRAA
jgi:hypothetical protein